MKTAIFCVLFLVALSGCASNDWLAQRNTPLDVQIRFLDSDAWADVRQERAACESGDTAACDSPEYPTVASVDGREVCIVYYPAHKGESRYTGLTQQFAYCN